MGQNQDKLVSSQSAGGLTGDAARTPWVVAGSAGGGLSKDPTGANLAGMEGMSQSKEKIAAEDEAVTHDLAIIGAGPAGLFAAMYATARQMRVVILDSLPMAGGQLAAMYPEKWVLDVPGFSRVMAGELAGRLAQQGLQDHPRWIRGHKAEQLEWDVQRNAYRIESKCSQGLGEIAASDGTVMYARGVLIAAGVGAIEPRKITCPGVEAFWGRGLVYDIGDVSQWAGKRVAVIGGNSLATQWAAQLANHAASLCLIARTDELKGTEADLAKLKSTGAAIQLKSEVTGINGADHPEQVTWRDEMGQEHSTVCDAVLVALGMVTDLGPMGRWGLSRKGGQIRVNETMETSLQNVWAAGDIAEYPGKLKLIATGFSEAACAVNHACHRLFPGKSVFPGHSTNWRAGG